MLVVLLLGRIMRRKGSADKKPVPATRTEVPAAAVEKPSPVSAGAVELYGTDPRDAAVIMAIVADRLGKPLEELRFKSIKEVK
jgi:hypothetical protein